MVDSHFFVNLDFSNDCTTLGLSPVESDSHPLRHRTEWNPFMPYFSEDSIHTKTTPFQKRSSTLPSIFNTVLSHLLFLNRTAGADHSKGEFGGCDS